MLRLKYWCLDYAWHHRSRPGPRQLPSVPLGLHCLHRGGHQAEKWPYRAAYCYAALLHGRSSAQFSMGNLPPKQMDESENRVEIRIVHRHISVWGQIGTWELATICCARAPSLLIQLADGLTFLNSLDPGKSFDISLLLPWRLCLFSIKRQLRSVTLRLQDFTI